MQLPRGLLAIALVWTVAAFAATVGLRVPIQPTSTSYTPGVRTLLTLLAMGGCLLWPLGRLATMQGAWSLRRIALDLATLLVVLQVVLWPMQLVTYWPPARGAALDLAISGWIVASAGVIALGARSRGWTRSLWSLAWGAVVAAGPLLDVLGVPAPWPAVAGPVVAILELAPLRPGTPAAEAWAIAIFPWIPASLLLAAAIRAPRGAGARLAPAPPGE
ncbi:MAG: hypothetical protein U0625_11170 [Phycisphaerales bacterium]